MDLVGVGPSVHQLVDRSREPVEGEHDVHVVGEQLAEQRVVQTVRMVLRPRQTHQVDHVDHPGLRLGSRVSRISAAAMISMVTTSPAQASTMSGSLLPSSLPAHDQIRLRGHSAQVASAMLSHCCCGCCRSRSGSRSSWTGSRWSATGQRVGVRGQVDRVVAPVGDHGLDQAGPLMGEAVVVVAQQVISRIFRLGTLARHGRWLASSSHLLCWIVCDELTMANAS